jgi:hypothetical protein
MTLQTLKSTVAVPNVPCLISTTPSGSSFTIDAANEIFAQVIRAPKTGNIRSVSYLHGGIGTGGDITVGIYDVDATTGNPADTPVAWDTNTFVTKTTATTDANDFVNSGNFTADAAVVAGDVFAVCYINPGASFGNIQFSSLADAVPSGFPYTTLFTASWAKSAQSPNVLLHYSDGTVEIPDGCTAIGDVNALGMGGNTYTVGTGSTPDVVGFRIVPPVPMTVRGAWFWLDCDGPTNVKLVTAAWDGASSGLLATALIDPDVRAAATAGIFYCTFDAAVELAAGSTYRCIVEPSSATTLVAYGFPCATSAQFNAQVFAGGMAATTAKDPNDDTDWTNYNNGTDGYRFLWAGLLVTHFSDGVGGGSAGFPATSMLNGVLQR